MVEPFRIAIKKLYIFDFKTIELKTNSYPHL